jgi:phosphoribosylformylglycinamidine synthase I
LRSAVIVFPGSNCDHDMYQALKLLGHTVNYVWHKNPNLESFDLVVLPGGFSYGDYLRAGAIARFSPIMPEVISFARKGKFLLGVCNGFQILTETGLLPGALLKNQNLRFACQQVFLRVENKSTSFTSANTLDRPLMIPIAHGEGNYFIERAGLEKLRYNQQIVFRYVDDQGNVSPEANPNGSVDNIAGVINKEGNILGMMPHPERAVEKMLGSADGRVIFESLQEANLKNRTALYHA